MSQHVNTVLAGMLDPEVFRKLDGKVPLSIFPKSSASIYECIRECHEKFDRPLKALEVYEIHVAGMPMATEAAKLALKEQYLAIAGPHTCGVDVANELLMIAHAKHMSETILTSAMQMDSNPKEWKTHLDSISEFIENSCRVKVDEEDYWEEITEFSIDTIEALNSEKNGVKIAIPEFNIQHPAVPKGRFVIWGARVETGKTSFAASLACLPGGFMDQGLRTLVITNEESKEVVMARYSTVRAGVDQRELIANKDMFWDIVKEIRKNVFLIDGTGFTVNDVEDRVAVFAPDVVIIDLLDKVEMPGTYDRIDLKHEALYRRMRDMAKKYNFALFGGSQLNDNASDRLLLTLNMLKDSRTGKAAEADAIWLIGKNPPDPNATDPDPLRCINLAKDKIDGRTGTHSYVTIDIPTGRYAA